MRQPIILEALVQLRAHVQQWRAAGERIGLVPTMGALHRGHLALIERAAAACDRVIVSIFVNPTQFAPNEDFSKYPRTLAEDLATMKEVDVDLVWLPSLSTMYPEGFATAVVPSGPANVGLEDAVRPTHFGGVATVVAKLFNQVQPDAAIFGEKDFQQLAVVCQMARDLDFPIEIVGVQTVREPNGLALSSRNVYLSDRERALAPILHETLCVCARKIAAGEKLDAVVARGRADLEQAGFSVDYLEGRDAATLAPVSEHSRAPLRLLIAARLGATRLIDNIAADVGQERPNTAVTAGRADPNAPIMAPISCPSS